jgi:uncharacterized protein YjdB
MKKSKKVIAVIASAVILQSVAAAASITAYGYTDGQTEAVQAKESVSTAAEQQESADEYASVPKAAALGDSEADTKTLHFGSYEYEVVDSTVKIVKYTGNESSVKIPDSINGRSVTKIGEYAFEEKQSLTEVILPNKLESIGDFAFFGCIKLKKLDIPQTVKEIGQNAVGYFEKNNIMSPVDGIVIIGHENETVKKYANECGFSYKDEDVIEASQITLNRSTAVLGVGESFKITATVTPQNAVAEVTYQSSNVNAVKVLSDGTVRAVGIGEARITVMTDNGKAAYCNVTVRRAPGSVSVSKSKVTLGVGEKYRLSCTLPYGTAANGFIYSSSNSSVVRVDKKTGEFTARGVGTAKLTVRTYNGKTAVCTVTVKEAPKSISLNKRQITLGIGEEFDLDSSLPSGCGAYSVKYSTNNSEIAAVRAGGGLVTAKAVGTAKIIVKTYNGKAAVCTVTVKKAPSSVGLNKTRLVLGVGEKFDLDSHLPSGCGACNVTYSTNNSKAASVRKAGGLVTAKAVGTAKITVKTYNGKTAVCTVIVKKPPKSVSLNKKEITLGVGEEFDLNSRLPSDCGAYNVTYSTNNSKVAVVRKAGGLVTAKAVGTAKITVKTYNGKKAVCTVTVKKAPNKITMNTDKITLGLKDSFTLYADCPKGSSCSSLTFTSSNPKVVSVDKKGKITAKSYGKAVITALSYNGKKTSCKVTVEKNIITDLTLIAKSQESFHGTKYRTWFYGAEWSGVDWCAIYVSWLYGRVDGINKYVVKTDGAGCFAREGVAKGLGKWYESNYSCPSTTPKAGDVVTFTWNGMGRVYTQDIYYSNHVAYVYAVDNTYIYTVEGNTVAKGEKYGTANNSRVVLKRYDKNSGAINGYFRPYY